ncbi:MAG: PAS domain S-box protein [Bacteroidota bacterium]|nr:PAS domain S-box protein [Bacteroidota bacterium]
MNKETRILLIEDKQHDIDLFKREVQKFGIQFTLNSISSFVVIPDALHDYRPDIIVCDYVLSNLQPVDAVTVLKNLADDIPFIIYSSVLDEAIVVQCMKAGASDYIFKEHSGRLGPAIHNILEKRRVREELKQSQERFNTLAKVSTVGIFLATADGRYLYVNERWSSITGLSPDAAIGDGFLQAVHSHDRKRITTEWNRCVRDQAPFRSEYRIQRPSDSSELWVLGEALPEFIKGGQVAGFVGTITDITYLMNSEIEIDSSRKQLRALTVRLQSVREEERKFISREIHDDLGQALTGLRMDLVWLTNKVSNGDDSVNQRLKSMMQLTDTTIYKVRKIATDLRPGILDDIGLAAAIEWHARDVGERAEIIFSFELNEEIQLNEQTATAFFRIFQESLTNVIRHAEASHVHVTLKKEGNTVVMSIEDDGRGIALNELSDPRSVGILGMRERAAVFGGEVSVIGVPNKGTTVRARIPLT